MLVARLVYSLTTIAYFTNFSNLLYSRQTPIFMPNLDLVFAVWAIFVTLSFLFTLGAERKGGLCCAQAPEPRGNVIVGEAVASYDDIVEEHEMRRFNE